MRRSDRPARHSAYQTELFREIRNSICSSVRTCAVHPAARMPPPLAATMIRFFRLSSSFVFHPCLFLRFFSPVVARYCSALEVSDVSYRNIVRVKRMIESGPGAQDKAKQNTNSQVKSQSVTAEQAHRAEKIQVRGRSKAKMKPAGGSSSRDLANPVG